MIFGLATHSFKCKDRRICLPPRQRCHDSPTKHIPLSLWVTATAYYALRVLCGIISSLSFLTQFRSFQNPKVVAVVVGRRSQYHMPMFLNSPTSPEKKMHTCRKAFWRQQKHLFFLHIVIVGTYNAMHTLGKYRADFYKTNYYPLYDPLDSKVLIQQK